MLSKRLFAFHASHMKYDISARTVFQKENDGNSLKYRPKYLHGPLRHSFLCILLNSHEIFRCILT